MSTGQGKSEAELVPNQWAANRMGSSSVTLRVCFPFRTAALSGEGGVVERGY